MCHRLYGYPSYQGWTWLADVDGSHGDQPVVETQPVEGFTEGNALRMDRAAL